MDSYREYCKNDPRRDEHGNFNDIKAVLEEMFEADRSMPYDDWMKRFGYFDLNVQLNGPYGPWCPPLSEIWRAQGQLPEGADMGGWMSEWPVGWEFLQELHRQYLSAKTGGATS